MRTTDIEYEVDGTTMIGRLALPDGDATRPAVLIAHEGGGLDDFQKQRAERFAELGYVAFALDYYGGKPLTERAEMGTRLTRYMEPGLSRAVATAGLDVLLAQPQTDPSKVAAVGYCFGGALVLELARTGADLKAIVGFHPGLTPMRPEDSVKIVGKVLMCRRRRPDHPGRAATRLRGRDARRRRRLAHEPLRRCPTQPFTNPAPARSACPDSRMTRRPGTNDRGAMLDLFGEVFS